MAGNILLLKNSQDTLIMAVSGKRGIEYYTLNGAPYVDATCETLTPYCCPLSPPGPQGPPGPAYTVVEVLPETLDVGEQVLFNGTMYRGLLSGESTLPAGTPFPVKGYKELSGWFYWNGVSIVSNFFKNEFDTDITLNRILAGQYDFTDPNGFFTGKRNQLNIFINQGSIENNYEFTANTDYGDFTSPNIYLRSILTGTPTDPTNMYERFNFKILLYPPQP